MTNAVIGVKKKRKKKDTERDAIQDVCERERERERWKDIDGTIERKALPVDTVCPLLSIEKGG